MDLGKSMAKSEVEQVGGRAGAGAEWSGVEGSEASEERVIEASQSDK
jgi:hypothetical protein